MEKFEWHLEYAITKKGTSAPQTYQGEILVPFAVESALSGVRKIVGEQQELWYQRTFDIPASWRGRRVLLHFGGVDWQTDVWVNDVKVGRHTEDLLLSALISLRR